jgi:hypothetical protein
MIRRYPALEDALRDIQSGKVTGITAVIVNQEWWQQQDTGVQTEYRRRCARAGVELRADNTLSRHFVELIGDAGEPPLETEHRV